MESDRFFSEADREAIQATVREAESRTSGEIVPFVVDRSDEYASAAWKGAALGALLAPLVALAIYRWTSVWGIPLAYWIALPAPVGGAGAYLLAAFLPPVRRWLTGEHVLEARVRSRAVAAFLDQEVFQTENRTGILLFVSLFERRVVLLADSGIHQKVETGQWESITRRLAAEIRHGRPGPALVAAIRECGEVLARHHVEIRPGDRNELGDELRRERD
jgi:putative membrane protein